MKNQEFNVRFRIKLSVPIVSNPKNPPFFNGERETKGIKSESDRMKQCVYRIERR